VHDGVVGQSVNQDKICSVPLFVQNINLWQTSEAGGFNDMEVSSSDLTRKIRSPSERFFERASAAL
jgi:hypothetical protein